MNSKLLNNLLWIPRLIAAVIMLQTLYFKFSASPESVYIFSTTGMEPWGRVGTGALELVAAVLILVPATTLFGAVLGIGLMGGALFFHITKLGIVVQNDGGLLFGYAVAVLLSCMILVYAKREQFSSLFKKQKTSA